MKDFSTYNLEDFSVDDSFIAWCLAPTPASDRFWQTYITNHPIQESTILKAKAFVLELKAAQQETNPNYSQSELWENISCQLKPARRMHIRKSWVYGTAATLLLCIGAYLWLAERQDDWVNLENNSSLTKSIILADGSKITLEPFSTLKYPKHFLGSERIVFLTGEAFFEIERDTLKPFLVYANETITKVLGTSFRISAYEGEEQVEVQVTSGKVAVYAQVKTGKKTTAKPLIIKADKNIKVPLPNKKLVIKTNQRIIFDKVQTDMVKMIAQQPKIVTNTFKVSNYSFKNEPIIDVFKILETAYKIDIGFDRRALQNCTITAKFQNESLFQKLEIICSALNLTFHEQDAKIVVAGAGCQQ